MDPFDLFGEGSTVPASGVAASGSQPASTDDSLFGGVDGHQGDLHTAHNTCSPTVLKECRSTKVH